MVYPITHKQLEEKKVIVKQKEQVEEEITKERSNVRSSVKDIISRRMKEHAPTWAELAKR